MKKESGSVSITEQAMLAFAKTPDTREFIAAPPVPTPDGYVRQTPVQVIKIAHGYKARIARRAVTLVIVIMAIACLAYALLPRLLA
ncbi:MAG: hypothetical protein LBH17_07330 [Oscillospiraceae bacterium]|jgi:hypothetical protein|nr:hypothetical protein [Oscillospiraceae bacterium]